jgi:hypothetical protein
MSSDQGGGGRPAPRDGWFDLGVWRRMANAVRRIVLLQSSVDELKMQVQYLNQRFDALQRQFDEESGQLIILASFVQSIG